VPDVVKEGMEIIPVSGMDQVLKHALIRAPEPIEWNFEEPKTVKTDQEDSASNLPH